MLEGDLTRAEAYVAALDTVPGWFAPVDAALFVSAARLQHAAGVSGDILEIGVYQGRTAIMLGLLSGDDEEVHLCDPFELEYDGVGDAWSVARDDHGYEAFMANWRRYLDRRPVVHRCPSTGLAARLGDRRFRVVHVDGSHDYDDVRGDVALALDVVAPGGLMVFDDVNNRDTPGVSAAVWERAADLVPLVLTPKKLYAGADTAHDPEALVAGVAGVSVVARRRVRGHPVLVVDPVTRPSRSWARRWLPPVALGVAVDARRRLRSRAAGTGGRRSDRATRPHGNGGGTS